MRSLDVSPHEVRGVKVAAREGGDLAQGRETACARRSGTASPIALRVSGLTCVPAGATAIALQETDVPMWSTPMELGRNGQEEASSGTGFALIYRQ